MAEDVPNLGQQKGKKPIAPDSFLPGSCNSSSAQRRPRRDPNPGNPSKARIVFQAGMQPTARQQGPPGPALRHGQQDRGSAGHSADERLPPIGPLGDTGASVAKSIHHKEGLPFQLCQLKIQTEEELTSSRLESFPLPRAPGSHRGLTMSLVTAHSWVALCQVPTAPSCCLIGSS